MSSLVADYDSSESVDSGSEESLENSTTENERLPPPAFTDKIKNSVFVNPFLEAENAKFAVLEKHVKMVPQSSAKPNKKTCWMFLKGKCRFGKKCKFSHGDEAGGLAPLAGPEPPIHDDPGSDEDEPKKKKKRPGLTHGLTPSKKVMTMYKKQKEL